MDLQEATHQLREEIESGIDAYIKRYGFFNSGSKARGFDPSLFSEDEIDEANRARQKIDAVIHGEMESNSKSYPKARKHYVKEAAFTFFNRMVGIKVMEANGLIDEAITERPEHGGRSLRHNLFLENHPKYGGTSGQGRKEFFREVFSDMAKELPALYRNDHPYSPFVPDSELIREVTEIVNKVSLDEWKRDDTLGWVYQYYNQPDKDAVYEGLSNSEKIDNRDKLIAATQLYTEDYMVDYLVENSLGRLWLEQNPGSKLREKMNYFDPHPSLQKKPEYQCKPVKEITFFDPACGSGHFLLRAFDLFYEMYLEEGYQSDEIPSKIIENNLYGTDLDERAVQIAIISLYLKASEKKKEVTGTSELELDQFNLTPARLEGLESNGAQWLKSELGYDASLNDIQKLLDQLDQVDTFGSLVKVPSILDKIAPNKTEVSSGMFEPELFAKNLEKRKKRLLDKLKEMTESENIANETLGIASIRKIHLLSLLTNKYDVVATNPPYMSKGNLRGDIKSFLENQYPNASKDIYAAFIEACIRFSRGFTAMINMQSFMFIKSFEKLREYLLDHAHIETMAHLGTDAFNEIGGEVVNTTMYILRRGRKVRERSSFIRLVEKDYNTKLNNLKKGISEKANHYSVLCSTFAVVPGIPFVYWAIKRVVNTFKETEYLSNYTKVPEGITTGNNSRFLRLWWEIFTPKEYGHLNTKSYGKNNTTDKRWFPCIKGGPRKKWYGNLWWNINWENEGEELKDFEASFIRNESEFLIEGLYSNKVSSKTFAARYMPKGHVYEHAAAPILVTNELSLYYVLGFMNSKIFNYFLNLLNPTMHYSVGTISNIPTKKPSNKKEEVVSELSKENTNSAKHLSQFSLIERNFTHTPLDWARKEGGLYSVDNAAKTYIDYKLSQEIKVLLNESVIDEEIFDLYELEEQDIQAIFKEEGKPAGYYHLLKEEDGDYLPESRIEDDEFDLTEEDLKQMEQLREQYVKGLEVCNLSDEEKLAIENKVLDLYNDNEDLRDISKEAEVNPLSALRIIKETDQVPLKKGRGIVHEFLFDKILKIMREDADGVVPLNPHCGEDTVYQRLQRKIDELSYETYEGFESYLKRGRTLKDWLFKDFLKEHCKRFSYSTYKGAIVWHLTSGKKRGFDVYVLHHKWSKDNLRKIRTVYLSNRRDFLKRRLSTTDREEERREWERIQAQIQEIDKMEENIKQLEEDPEYNPKVDDGVGKNIAPLQDAGLTSYDLLSKKQKEKYLNADW